MLQSIFFTILLIFQLVQANEVERVNAEITRAVQVKLARDTWKKLAPLRNLNIENIGLEVWIAEPNGGNLESRFGHVFLRIVGSGKQNSEDILIGFVAKTPYKFSYIDGVTGTYPVAIQAITLEQTLDQYVINEGRSISAIIIPSTKESRRSLIENLILMHKEPQNNGNYYFFGQNCTSVLQTILAKNNIISLVSETQFPTRIDDVFLANGVSVFPKRYIINPKKLEVSYLNGDKSTELISQWGHLFFSSKEDTLSRLSRFNYLKNIGQKPLISSFSNNLNLPINLYQRCLDEDCIMEAAFALKTVFTQSELDGMCFRLKRWLKPNRFLQFDYNLQNRKSRVEQFINLDHNLKSMCGSYKVYNSNGLPKRSIKNGSFIKIDVRD